MKFFCLVVAALALVASVASATSVEFKNENAVGERDTASGAATTAGFQATKKKKPTNCALADVYTNEIELSRKNRLALKRNPNLNVLERCVVRVKKELKKKAKKKGAMYLRGIALLKPIAGASNPRVFVVLTKELIALVKELDAKVAAAWVRLMVKSTASKKWVHVTPELKKKAWKKVAMYKRRIPLLRPIAFARYPRVSVVLTKEFMGLYNGMALEANREKNAALYERDQKKKAANEKVNKRRDSTKKCRPVVLPPRRVWRCEYTCGGPGQRRC